MEWLESIVGKEYLLSLFGPNLIKWIAIASGVWGFLKWAGGWIAKLIQSIAEHFIEMRDEVKALRMEVHDFKDVFKAENRAHNKRISEIEGTLEAVKFEVYEIKTDLKQLKKEH